MIFSPDMRREILAGRKTETRRPARGDGLCGYQPGKRYAVQPGRGKPSDGVRILVTAVNLERLGDLTYDCARREGFKTRDHFRDHWMRLHDRAWVDKNEGVLDPSARFDQRWADTFVHVIRFELADTGTVRFLAEGWPDYTTTPGRAMRDEPQALSEAEYQAHVAGRERMTTDQWQALERRRLERRQRAEGHDARIAHAIDVARRNGVDIHAELRPLNKRDGRSPDAIERQIQKLERKVFLRRAA